MALIDKLTGLFQSGAAKVVDSIGDALDKNITNKEELAIVKLEVDKELNRHLEAIQNNAKEITLAELKDMDSARNREIQIATSEKAPLINKIIQPLLAILILGSCFLMWYIILFKDIPDSKRELVAGIVGSLTTISMGVVSYFFGSSTGSAAKQKQLDKVMNA